MLLSSTEFSDKLKRALKVAEDSVVVLSAFIKANALKWVLENSKAKSTKIITRWRKHDLVSGVSDFECYQICQKANVDFGISLDLHGKVFCIDSQIFVGSANLTSRGLALAKNFNDEFGIGFMAGKTDKIKIESYLHNVVWLNDSLAKQMEQEINEPLKKITLSEEKWSLDINKKLTEPVRYLWVHELLFTHPSDLLNFEANNEHHQHDFELLSLNIDNLDKETLACKFKISNSYRWLENILSEEGYLSFGAVSERLHNSILDDLLPYRREIKVLVANLFEWFSLIPEFEISRPRHSQVIKQL